MVNGAPPSPRSPVLELNLATSSAEARMATLVLITVPPPTQRPASSATGPSPASPVWASRAGHHSRWRAWSSKRVWVSAGCSPPASHSSTSTPAAPSSAAMSPPPAPEPTTTTSASSTSASAPPSPSAWGWDRNDQSLRTRRASGGSKPISSQAVGPVCPAGAQSPYQASTASRRTRPKAAVSTIPASSPARSPAGASRPMAAWTSSSSASDMPAMTCSM
jgi:hypothetical protein